MRKYMGSVVSCPLRFMVAAHCCLTTGSALRIVIFVVVVVVSALSFQRAASASALCACHRPPPALPSSPPPLAYVYRHQGVRAMPWRSAFSPQPETPASSCTQVPVGDNYYAALNSAVFSDGSFVYVPKGVRSPMELSTYFRINASETGQVHASFCGDRGRISISC